MEPQQSSGVVDQGDGEEKNLQDAENPAVSYGAAPAGDAAPPTTPTAAQTKTYEEVMASTTKSEDERRAETEDKKVMVKIITGVLFLLLIIWGGFKLWQMWKHSGPSGSGNEPDS
jgi:hypothetical protein